jgi:arylsulfatase A-like enzyme
MRDELLNGEIFSSIKEARIVIEQWQRTVMLASLLSDASKVSRMRTLFLLFDSLNAGALSCYGAALATPNFDRLAERAVTFDSHYIGSMPCMPARRDMHTGRLSFLHRSWGRLSHSTIAFLPCSRTQASTHI